MQILGSVDRCDETFIEGWATIVGQPDVKPGLALRLGQEIVGRCIANLFRKDLQDGGVAQCGHRRLAPRSLYRRTWPGIA
jgi:hypothetical protein